VREGFQTIAREQPGRVKILDATAPVAEITARITAAILDLVSR
jgi:thymidylate kinase